MPPPPPAWAIRLVSELDASDQRAKTLAGSLTPHQLNWKPNPSSWSVGQCLDHLRATNEVYLPQIADSLAGPPSEPVPDIRPGWFGRWFIRNYIDPSPATKRAKAPTKIAPANEVSPDVTDRFLASNDATRDLIHRASNHDVNGIRFRNPFIPLLRFTVGTGFEIVSRHQRRHLLQAEHVKQTPSFPGPQEDS